MTRPEPTQPICHSALQTVRILPPCLSHRHRPNRVPGSVRKRWCADRHTLLRATLGLHRRSECVHRKPVGLPMKPADDPHAHWSIINRRLSLDRPKRATPQADRLPNMQHAE